jgi:hypothetical protein
VESEGRDGGYVEAFGAAALSGDAERIRMCYTKDRYPSVESAELTITRRKTCTKKLLRVYRCDYCGGYHLTSQPPAMPAAA